MSDLRTEDAFAACAAIVRERARNFWWGLRLLPEPKRSYLFAIYAWMREADDLVDDDAGTDPARLAARIAAFRAATDAALGGRAAAPRPLWVALAEVARRVRLDPREFHDMLAGQLADTGPVRCRDWDDLRTVCYRVAGTVGVVCVRVWGGVAAASPAPDEAIPLAIERGIAFQLTNILRDFREDAERGRLYLPDREFHAYGITPGDLLAWRDPPACRAFLAFQCERARSRYEASAALDALVAPDCRPTLAAMTGIYRGLLERIAADPRGIVREGRISLSPFRKALIAFRARRAAAGGGR